MRGIPFDIETYMAGVESYTSGKKTVEDIITETGMSRATFFNKLGEFREKGRIDPPKPIPNLKRTEEFCDKITELKKAHPKYGRTRLTRELAKQKEFEKQRLSDWNTARALRQLNLQLPPKRGDSTTRKSRQNYQKKTKRKTAEK
jgi:hypothetical protein